jgi:hypothetical protein
MLPVKTCSGVFLATDGSVGFSSEECLECVSNRSGCAQCMIANRRALIPASLDVDGIAGLARPEGSVIRPCDVTGKKRGHA